jgi:hypothetical protein
MGAGLRSWWQKIKKPLAIVGIIVVCALGITLIVGIIGGYLLNWGWTGLNGPTATEITSSPKITKTLAYQPGKTLWDWLQLLIIPLVLAIAALLFNLATTRTEQKIAKDRIEQDRQIAKERYENDQRIALDKQREDLLQIYLDRMSELLLKEELGSSAAKPEVRNVARVRTATILVQLDARRIGYVFAFLRQSGLMSTKPNDSIVSLSQTDLSKINLSQATLYKADLSGADLSGANLSRANLIGAKLIGAGLYQANLSGADLGGADLGGANLRKADLSGAGLSGAIVTSEQLETAKSLQGATMPDRSKHS